MTKFNQTYPTDDGKYTEWQLIADYFPAHQMGRPAQMGNVADYQCDPVRQSYRMPMADVAGQFSSVANSAIATIGGGSETGCGQRINAVLVKTSACKKAGRNEQPSAAVI